MGCPTRHPGRHNLACKPAAVVKGTARAGLLDTYDQERRPTGRLTMSQALARFGTRVTVVEMADRLLAQEEPEASVLVEQVFATEGIRVNLVAAGPDARQDGVRVHPL